MNKFGTIKRLCSALACCVAVVVICVSVAGCWLFDPDGPPVAQSKYLCDIYEDYFSIGAAVLPSNLGRYDEAELMKHFNSITAENDMKWRFVEPAEGVYSFGAADELVAWAQEHDTAVRGHCLVWYKSLPSWLVGKQMTKQQALNIIDKHVTDVMTHFGDSIYAWDVCNEVLRNTISDVQLAKGDVWRTGDDVSYEANSVDWYALCGVDFIKQAFRSADKVRTELGLDVKLYYNDYNLNSPNKRQAVVQLVEMLRADGIAIDGIGMQSHYRLPDYQANSEAFMQNFEDSVKTFTEMGLDVQITELDIQVYESSDSPQAFDALPREIELQQAQMFADIFAVCRKYAHTDDAEHGTVTNVTTWGVADDHTYATTSIHREFPLIFASDYSEKRAYYEIISFE